jgi:hypothetical protein
MTHTNKIKVSDIVRFKSPTSEAAEFCIAKGITGKVVEIDLNMCVVDIGLYYKVYSPMNSLDLVTTQAEAPIPEDW